MNGNELEAAMWLEVVRLVTCLTDAPGRAFIGSAILPLPPEDPDEGQAQYVRSPTLPYHQAAIDTPRAQNSVPHQVTVVASDRVPVRTLTALTLFAGVLGAATLCAISIKVPQKTVILSSAHPAAAPPPIVAAATRPADAPFDLIATAFANEPRAQAAPQRLKHAPIHKPARKRITARRQHHEKSFWTRVAAIFR
jgi:hypothetical protein